MTMRRDMTASEAHLLLFAVCNEYDRSLSLARSLALSLPLSLPPALSLSLSLSLPLSLPPPPSHFLSASEAQLLFGE
jgi:hypothetical protein